MIEKWIIKTNSRIKVKSDGRERRSKEDQVNIGKYMNMMIDRHMDICMCVSVSLWVYEIDERRMAVGGYMDMWMNQLINGRMDIENKEG